ncbi:MAG: hypothetical protein ACIAS6_00460 [Phycisphaerales bacterium JB060]
MDAAWLVGWVSLAIALLWVLLAAIGTPRATLPRRWKGRAHSAVCGACGHPAVDLGRIGRCPECGTDYQHGGVLTRAAAVRLGPPYAVVVLLVVWAGVMAWTYLVPWAAGVANLRTIGARDVLEIERRAMLQQDTRNSMIHAYPTGWQRKTPDFTIEISQSLVRADTPPLAGDGALNGDPRVVVRMVVAGGGQAVLRWARDGDRWTLHAKDGGEIDAGGDLREGMRALFAATEDPPRLRTGTGSHTVPITRTHEIADAIEATGELAGKQMMGRVRYSNDGGLVGSADQRWPEMLQETVTTHRTHRLAPAGVAAAAATRALVVLAGLLVLLGVALVRRRVLATGGPDAPAGGAGTAAS